MQQHSRRAVEIALEQFPPWTFFGQTAESPVSPIACCVEQLMSRIEPGNGKVMLPSLSQLKEHFCCSHLDMYDVLRTLRQHGYDYSFGGLDAPLHMWRIPVTQE